MIMIIINIVIILIVVITNTWIMMTMNYDYPDDNAVVQLLLYVGLHCTVVTTAVLLQKLMVENNKMRNMRRKHNIYAFMYTHILCLLISVINC